MSVRFVLSGSEGGNCLGKTVLRLGLQYRRCLLGMQIIVEKESRHKGLYLIDRVFLAVGTPEKTMDIACLERTAEQSEGL